MQNKKVQFIDWGLVDYQDAWNRQEDIFAKTLALKQENRTLDQQNPTPNYLIFTEHPHVYTLGKSGHEEYLLLDEEGLKEKEATFYKINRGGDITYHGPGQIVGYPILDLDNFLRISTSTYVPWKKLSFGFVQTMALLRAVTMVIQVFGLTPTKKTHVKSALWVFAHHAG